MNSHLADPSFWLRSSLSAMLVEQIGVFEDLIKEKMTDKGSNPLNEVYAFLMVVAVIVNRVDALTKKGGDSLRANFNSINKRSHTDRINRINYINRNNSTCRRKNTNLSFTVTFATSVLLVEEFEQTCDLVGQAMSDIVKKCWPNSQPPNLTDNIRFDGYKAWDVPNMPRPSEPVWASDKAAFGFLCTIFTRSMVVFLSEREDRSGASDRDFFLALCTQFDLDVTMW